MAYFPEILQKFLYKKVIVKIPFENGNKEFRGIFYITPDNSVITLSNTSEIYPPFPFIKIRDFYFELIKPGIGIQTLMNYYEFEPDYSISFDQQFEIGNFDVEEDDQFYGNENPLDYKLFIKNLSIRLNDNLKNN